MEQNNRKTDIGTIILFILGSIFVAVAGSIFVYKNWKYMSETLKDLLVIAASIGCFTGAYFSSKNEKFKITEIVLYYLGTIFASLSVISLITPEMLETLPFVDHYRHAQDLMYLLSLLPEVVAFSVRFIKKRTPFDLWLTGIAYIIYILAIEEFFDFDYPQRSIPYFIFYAGIVMYNLYLRKNQPNDKITANCNVFLDIYMISFMLLGSLGNALATIGDLFDRFDFDVFVSVVIVILSFALMLYYVKRVPSIFNMIISVLYMFNVVLTFAAQDWDDIFFLQDLSGECVAIVWLLGIYGIKLIFDARNINTEWLRFILNVIVECVMLAYNLDNGELINVFAFSVVNLALLAYSIIKSDKKYTILSAISMALVVLYMTRDFWKSINWWVYLLVVGIAMIYFAIKREGRIKSEPEKQPEIVQAQPETVQTEATVDDDMFSNVPIGAEEAEVKPEESAAVNEVETDDFVSEGNEN